MQLRPLLIAPLIGIAMCVFVLWVPQVVQFGYPTSWTLVLGEMAFVGLYMVPAAYIAEFGLFLPIHRYLVRRNVQHLGVYAIVGLLVGALAGPLGLMFTVTVILQRNFKLHLPNVLALRGTAVAGACAGAVAALVFRAMSKRTR